MFELYHRKRKFLRYANFAMISDRRDAEIFSAILSEISLRFSGETPEQHNIKTLSAFGFYSRRRKFLVEYPKEIREQHFYFKKNVDSSDAFRSMIKRHRSK
jgi:hypothetical protein